jgi:phosphoglucomutase
LSIPADLGADHVREKDGLWAALAWLSVLEHANNNSAHEKEGDDIAWVSVADVAKSHWREFGRDFYCRMDFEECGSAEAEAMVDHLRTLVGAETDFAPSLAAALKGLGGLQSVSEFEYVDSVDGSTAKQQGIVLAIGENRAVFRLSGTGSAGATIRLYLVS